MESTIAPRLISFAIRQVDWTAVYAEYLPRVYNFFLYRIPNTADVEDLTAATFEKAWRGRGTYREDLAGMATWLFAIARNVAVDHLRAAKVHVPLEEAGHIAAEVTPEQEAVANSNRARLKSLIEGLKPRESELVALKYGAGLTNRDIAQVTGLTESNVGTVLHRTVQILRAGWE